MMKLTILLILLQFGLPIQSAQPKRHKNKLLPQEMRGEPRPKASKTKTGTNNSNSDDIPTMVEPEIHEDSVQVESLPTFSPSFSSGCEQKHSIETFLQIPTNRDPQADPKGGVYFISDLREVPQIYHLAEPKAWPKQISYFSDGVVYYKLSPNGKKILLATQESGNEQYQIHLYDTETRETTPLITDKDARVESVAWSPDSQWFAFTSNRRNKVDFDLYLSHLTDKKTKLITELTGMNSVQDISPNAEKVSGVQFRSVIDSSIWVWDLKSSTSLLMESLLTKSTERTLALSNPYFSNDSAGLFYLSDEQSEMSSLFYLPLDNSKSKRKLSSGKWGVEEIFLSNDRKRILYSTNEEGYSLLEGFTLDDSGHKRKLISVAQSKNSVIKTASFSKGQGKDSYFFTETNSTSPSDVWLWNGSKKIQWTESAQGLIGESCLYHENLVHYPSFDKKEIPAFLFKPSKGPVPFIIMIHGGPESQYRPQFSKIFQYFLERGFGVFAPNIRGSVGYGRDYLSSDNYKLRMNSIQDITEGAKWLLQNGFAKPGKLAIYGGSYGGFAVLRAIETEPKLFSAAAEMVGITNFVTFLENTKPYRRALREVEYGPLSDVEFLKSISPIHFIDKIETPLLIFHGAKDPRVPVTETKQIVEELKRKDIPVDYKIFEDEGHGNIKLKNIMEQAKQMAYFFEKHLNKK